MWEHDRQFVQFDHDKSACAQKRFCLKNPVHLYMDRYHVMMFYRSKAAQGGFMITSPYVFY